MIDLPSVVAFFDKTRWTKRTVTHEMNRVLRENTLSYSTLGKYVRMFALSTKETDTPIVSESEGYFSLDDCITFVLSKEAFHSITKLLRR
jgi:hypothetical protein